MNDIVIGKGLQEEALKAAEKLEKFSAETVDTSFLYGGVSYTLSKVRLTEDGLTYITTLENGSTYYLYRGGGPT